MPQYLRESEQFLILIIESPEHSVGVRGDIYGVGIPNRGLNKLRNKSLRMRGVIGFHRPF